MLIVIIDSGSESDVYVEANNITLDYVKPNSDLSDDESDAYDETNKVTLGYVMIVCLYSHEFW
jgi:hypothetical protein